MLFSIILAGVQCLVKCFKPCIPLSASFMESILNHVHGYNDDILELVVKDFLSYQNVFTERDSSFTISNYIVEERFVQLRSCSFIATEGSFLIFLNELSP